MTSLTQDSWRFARLVQTEHHRFYYAARTWQPQVATATATAFNGTPATLHKTIQKSAVLVLFQRTMDGGVSAELPLCVGHGPAAELSETECRNESQQDEVESQHTRWLLMTAAQSTRSTTHRTCPQDEPAERH
ncbi:hypothetical protein AOLI_G00080770 [Acnodon oligacanthus]